MGRFFFLLCLSVLQIAHSVQWPQFDRAMGKGTTAWDFIRTPEDKRKLAAFKAPYEEYRAARPFSPAETIPNVVHWVWLGPKPLSRDSLEKMKRWIALHPEWRFKLWTDQKREALPKEVEVCDPLSLLGDASECYFDSDSFGERSELVRLCVLLSEGGLYTDHDVEPLISFDPLAEDFSFFCGLETLQSTVLSSSVYPSTHLIGSVPEHPIVQEALAWLIGNWKRLEGQFPGSDDGAVFNRVKHRGFRALAQGIDLHGRSEGAMVFPSAFFSEQHPEKALYAAHLHAGSWLKKEGASKLREAFAAVEEELSFSLMMLVGLGLCNGVLGIFLFNFLRRAARRRAA